MKNIRPKIINEIEHIPENKLEEIYEILHYFRLGLASEQKKRGSLGTLYARKWKGDESAEELINMIVSDRKNKTDDIRL